MRKSMKLKFVKVYNEYSNLVYRIALNQLKDSYVAEEVVQDVFVKFYEKIEDIDDCAIKIWLVMKTKSMSIDLIRRNQVREKCLEKITREMVVSESNTQRIVDKLSCLEESQMILEDLKVRNQGWYQVVSLICVQGKTLQEASEELNLSTQVLSARLSRARKYIREHYSIDF